MSIFRETVNNYGLTPLTGSKFKVAFLDASSGMVAYRGDMQSFTFSIRNSTESYLSLGEQWPEYLSGENQGAWVAEQGMVDVSIVARVFGHAEGGRQAQLTNMPRLGIIVDANYTEAYKDFDNRSNNLAPEEALLRGKRTDLFPEESIALSNMNPARGTYFFQGAKVDSVSVGIMPGRRTAAVRLEGVFSGYKFISGQSFQEYRDILNFEGDTQGTGPSNSSIITPFLNNA
jgi:hypothetical protein